LTATPSHPPSGPEIPQTGAVQRKVLGCRPARGWTVDSGQKSGTLDRARLLLHSGRRHPSEELTTNTTIHLGNHRGRAEEWGGLVIPQRSRFPVPTSVPAASDFRPAADPVAPGCCGCVGWGFRPRAGADLSLSPESQGHFPEERKQRNGETEADLQTAQSHWMPCLGCLGRSPLVNWAIDEEPRPPRPSGHKTSWHISSIGKAVIGPNT
jgi:hypothetical protein